METIMREQEALEQKKNLGKTLDDVQSMINQLKDARNNIASNPDRTSIAMASLQNPVKQGFDQLHGNLKDIYAGLNHYSKALDKKFKDRPLPVAENDALAHYPSLINRAVAMHLLREGHFDVATRFISEVNDHPPTEPPTTDAADAISEQTQAERDALWIQFEESQAVWDADFSPNAFRSRTLQQQFAEMYHILNELRNKGNLAPAIQWAQKNAKQLEDRGSNLEYDLCRLQYISLFTSSDPYSGSLAAIAYARDTFPRFPSRHAAQTQALLGALAFSSNIGTSPYASLFSSNHDSHDAVVAAAQAFTSEFCALLKLSSASPLLTAVTAGCIALPTLLKLSQIQATHRTSWTTQTELPVEIPLPPSFQFHSIFVCPVSKEQGTDLNPPMMMPCGHVLALESLDKLGRGGRFKCPYCPAESHVKDAIKVFL